MYLTSIVVTEVSQYRDMFHRLTRYEVTESFDPVAEVVLQKSNSALSTKSALKIKYQMMYRLSNLPNNRPQQNYHN